jgi:diguanylate cyclase (GGDEF)-like protein/PAS domain S-box-containing protein
MSHAKTESVLLIECQPKDTRLIINALQDDAHEGLQIECIKKLSDGLDRIQKGKVRGIILDIEMSNGRGVATFEKLRAAAPHVPILILSGVENENIARQAVHRGARDYLLKSNFDHFRLRRAVHLMVERHAIEEKAYLQQRCAEATLACTGDAVIISDSADRITHLNGPAELLTGWSEAEARGHSLNEILGHTACDNQTTSALASSALAPPLASGPQEDTPCSDTATLVRRDGVELNIKNCSAYIRDRDGSVTGTVAVLHNLGAVRERTLELSHAAQHDFLTGLPNRSLVNDRITQAISFAARYTKQLAVMFVDLDLFKRINDSLGHAVGDKLLQQVATRIVACVRRSDTVGRIGGDEFIVLLSQVGHAEDAVFIARKILSSLAAPYLIDQKQLQINASIGVSTYPADGTDSETLIHRADTAMYEAKKLGRNNCQFFRPEMQARVLEWQSLEGSLRCALERNEFMLVYQPKIDLATGEISGVEALLRWNHPERGLIQPLKFVPIAEESGLIVPIGQWVLLEACRQARAWMDAGLPPVRIAVNVSALQFAAKDFLSSVRAALISTGIDPSNLELELTETVLMQDAESAVQMLRALKAIGVQLAIDDFGVGYSSFSYLRKFPLDALKVDRSFINDISSNPDNATILSALINIGKSLKHRVVAEGVETEEQLHFLQKEGCSEGQGYFFCRPVIAEKFAQFLERGVTESVVH